MTYQAQTDAKNYYADVKGYHALLPNPQAYKPAEAQIDKVSTVAVAVLQDQQLFPLDQKERVALGQRVVVPKIIPCEPQYEIDPSSELAARVEEILQKKSRELNLTDSDCLQAVIKLLIDYSHSNDAVHEHNIYNEYQSDPKTTSKYIHECMSALDPSTRQTILENMAFKCTAFRMTNVCTRHSSLTYQKAFFQLAEHSSPLMLLAGISIGDKKLVRKCIQALGSIAVQFEDGYSPIHAGLMNNQFEMLEILIKEPTFHYIDQAPTPLLFIAKTPKQVSWLLLQTIIKISDDPRRLFDDPDYPLQNWVERIFGYGSRSPEETANYSEMIIILLSKRSYLLTSETFHFIYTKVVNSKDQNALGLFFELLKYRPNINQSMVKDIRQRILIDKDMRFLKCLSEVEQKEISVILKNANLPLGQLQHKAILLKDRLKNEMIRWNLAPEMISFELINEAHLLKKQFQEQMRKQVQEKDVKEGHEAFKQFLTVYREAFTRHPILNKIREIRREFINGDKSATVRINKLFALCGVTSDGREKIAGAKENARSWKQVASRMYGTLAEVYKWIVQLPQDKRTLKLLHGTRSPAWQVISQADALVASGKLFAQGIAPLTGEGSAAYGGANVRGISTMQPDEEWDQVLMGFGGSYPTRYHVAEGYAVKTSSESTAGARPLIFSLEAEYEILKNSVASLMQSKPLSVVFWFDFKRAIYRLRATDKDFIKKTTGLYQNFKKYVEAARKNGSLPNMRDCVEWGPEECLKEWKKNAPIHIDITDPLLKDPIPMVFASTNIDLDPEIAEARDGDEVLITEPLYLRGDLQLIFTQLDSVSKLQVSAAEKGMHVLPFEAGRYLQMRAMTWKERERNYPLSYKDKNALSKYVEALLQQNAKNPVWQNIGGKLFIALSDKNLNTANYTQKAILEIFGKLVSSDIYQKNLIEIAGEILKDFTDLKAAARNHHRDILPFYAEPYPETATYLDEDLTEHELPPGYAVDQPTYESYMKGIEALTRLPREVHGAMHSTRATLFSLMLIELYGKAKLGISVSKDKLAAAVGLHDSGRKNEGADHWDLDSSIVFRNYMEPSKEIITLRHAIENKDPKDGKFETTEQEIVNGADTLEIFRVLDVHGVTFDKSKLPFYNMEELANYPKDALIAEARQFIKITESKALKLHLEHHSKDYLTDLMRIFSYLHESKNKCFPHMAELLGPTLVALTTGQPALGKEIISLL